MESYIGIYTISEVNGALTEKEIVPLLPNSNPELDYAAEIEIYRGDKHFLYASTRRKDTNNGAIVVFEINVDDGSLKRIQVRFFFNRDKRQIADNKIYRDKMSAQQR